MARILYGKEVSSALWERLLPRIDRLAGRTAWRRRSPLCAWGSGRRFVLRAHLRPPKPISMALPCAASCANGGDAG